jgi:hypothetical protein
MIMRICYKSVLLRASSTQLTLFTQCAIPVFDSLLPEPHNTYVLKLLFELAHWHGLAKLRMHTDVTLDILSRITASLGNSLRTFEAKTSAAFETRELERERAARQRRQEKSATSGVSKSKRPMAPDSKAQKQKKFNLMTYKYHALGHYVDTIRCFGTTDSYSTQPVSVCMMQVCMIMLTYVVGIRASLSTVHPKLDHFGRAADQYHSKYRRLSDESAVSA